MKIYKVRAWVNERDKKGNIAHPYSFEEIIIDNLKTAKGIYSTQLTNTQSFEYINDRQANVELFEPHVFDNGTLAYWPDNDEYIEKYETVL